MSEANILRASGNVWNVESKGTKGKWYQVRLKGKKLICNCAGYQYRGYCWHVKTIQEKLKESVKKYDWETGIYFWRDGGLRYQESIPLSKIGKYSGTIDCYYDLWKTPLGKEEPVVAPLYFILSHGVDRDYNDVLEDVRNLVFLLKALGVKKLFIWFAGGDDWISRREVFNITVPPSQLGIAVELVTPQEWQRYAWYFRTYMTMEIESIDTWVYSTEKVGVWKVPNTKSSKTNLYKIRITEQELANWSMKKIMELAKYPRLKPIRR